MNPTISIHEITDDWFEDQEQHSETSIGVIFEADQHLEPESPMQKNDVGVVPWSQEDVDELACKIIDDAAYDHEKQARLHAEQLLHHFELYSEYKKQLTQLGYCPERPSMVSHDGHRDVGDFLIAVAASRRDDDDDDDSDSDTESDSDDEVHHCRSSSKDGGPAEEEPSIRRGRSRTRSYSPNLPDIPEMAVTESHLLPSIPDIVVTGSHLLPIPTIVITEAPDN